jgi:hypothetical protein
MKEMLAIFSVTDEFGISRESVRVPLEKTDPGSVSRNASGILEITVPLTMGMNDFLEILEVSLQDLGFAKEQA